MAEENANEKGKSILEKFKEIYPDCLEGYVEDVYVESVGIKEPKVSWCSIRQAKISGHRLTLLVTDRDLNIPPVGVTKGHRVSFFATKVHGGNYDGILVALLNYHTGRGYEAKIPLRSSINTLKWQDIQEPL